MTTTYIADDRYHAALDAVEKIARDHDDAAPDMLRTLLIEAVGDHLGIWPSRCAPGQHALPATASVRA